MTRRSLVVPVGIVVATVVAAMVVLVGGGPDRWGYALALLIGVPLLVAMGGGSDAGRAAMPPPDEPSSTAERTILLVSVLPVVLLQLGFVAVMVWQVVASVAAGDVVFAVALVPLMMYSAWRGRQISRRLGRRPAEP
jgi:hypothetical protein